MRKLLFTSVFLGTSLFAGDMVGWISDSACGAANASADKGARECASACLKGGHKAVFVSDGDNKVYKLSDPAQAAKFLDKKVKVAGTVKGDTLELKSIAYAQ